MVKPTVHTNPSQKRSFSKTLFKTEEFENRLFVFVWSENGAFENDYHGNLFCDFPHVPRRVFLKNQIQDGRCLSRF